MGLGNFISFQPLRPSFFSFFIYWLASRLFSLNKPFSFLVSQVFLGERVKLLEGVTLGPGCVIGDNVVIGPNVSLPANTKVSTVMPEVRVSDKSCDGGFFLWCPSGSA